MAIHPTGPKEFGSRFGNETPTAKNPLRFFALHRGVSWTENPCVGGSIPPQATST